MTTPHPNREVHTTTATTPTKPPRRLSERVRPLTDAVRALATGRAAPPTQLPEGVDFLPPSQFTRPPVRAGEVGGAPTQTMQDYVVLGERHRLQIEMMLEVLPAYGVWPHACGKGLRNLSETLQQLPTAGLLLIQPSQGLLAALGEQPQMRQRRSLVVLCPEQPTRFYLRDIVRVAPKAVLPVDTSLGELQSAVQQIAFGGAFVAPRLQTEICVGSTGRIALVPHPDLLELTGRQLEVVRLTAIGCSTRDISERLGLATKTVESHRYRAMRKLNVHDRVELTRVALSQGLLR